MNNDDVTQSTGLRLIPRKFRIGLSWTFLVAILFFNACCKDEEVASSDEYYIKYTVNSTTIYMGDKLEVKINSEKNAQLTTIINQREPWESIIGPVPKGFVASINVTAIGSTSDQLRLSTSIYSSKNNSPFALKKTDNSDLPRDNVQLSYTIDY